MTAFRANIKRCFQVFFVQNGFAGRALDPYPFGNAPPPFVTAVNPRGQNFFDPTHGLFPMNTRFYTRLCSFPIGPPDMTSLLSTYRALTPFRSAERRLGKEGVSKFK